MTNRDVRRTKYDDDSDSSDARYNQKAYKRMTKKGRNYESSSESSSADEYINYESDSSDPISSSSASGG